VDRSHEVSRSPVVGPSKPRLLKVLGPGLISGAANDDPTAIATYSQAGAQFGFALSWLMFVVYPLMAVVQQVSARIGRTTGNGLAGNVRLHYPRWLLQIIVLLLLVSNVVAISADLAAMADVLHLLIGGPPLAYVLLFGGICVLLQIYMQYTRYVAVLKWITLSLLSYFGAVLMVDVRWSRFLDAILNPRIAFDKDYLMMIVAIFGVALSPYIVFWQSSQEAEDQRVRPKREPLVEAPEQAPKALERIRLDTYIGMAMANLVGLAIIITTAATLHASGIDKIESSAQAAEALRPIAGPFAFAVFALGIIGTGLLAVPVLAGSAAYAIGEAKKWPVGLARPPLEAKAFYATLATATLVGVGINFIGLDAMRALYWSAVVMGVIAVPLLAMMIRMASKPEVMGEFAIDARLQILGWAATAIMAVSVAAMGIAAVW
jgi:NRAMP (natural resistance-associated macrophage protein)-like metal ion transporter